MTFGEKLKLLRYEKGLTQDDIGYLLNVTKSCISCYESGTRQPSLDILIQLATYFHVSIDFLIGIEEYNGSMRKEIKLTNKDVHFLNELKKDPIIYSKMIDNIPEYVSKIKEIFK